MLSLSKYEGRRLGIGWRKPETAVSLYLSP